MSDLTFHVSGPLMADLPFYVRRDADDRAAAHLERMEYITLVEPRQSGKTSLINQLVARFSRDGYVFAVRDLSAAKSWAGSRKEWYGSLGRWILDQLGFITPGERPGLPSDGGSWESFLVEIARRAQAKGLRIVIVLDEVGALPPDWATDFFLVIRSVYSTRQSLTFYQHLTFIIAGAFDPRSLIRDASVSDFNVDHRIPLEDFNVAQLSTLVRLLGLPARLCEDAVARLYYWTGGQPYLCQWLCLHLRQAGRLITDENLMSLVDNGVASFLQKELQHLSRIKGLQGSPEMLAYVRLIVTDPRARFSAGLNDKHFYLAHVVGLIKTDEDGLCQIRNRLYERALAEIEDSAAAACVEMRSDPCVLPPAAGAFEYDVFVSYSREDAGWVRDKLVPYLESERVRFCIDSREFPVGEATVESAEKGVRLSQKIILVMTPAWVRSAWGKYEVLLMLTRHPSGGGRILPLMLRECVVPEVLKPFNYLDLTEDESFSTQMPILLTAIRKPLS